VGVLRKQKQKYQKVYVYIDGQNLYIGTMRANPAWRLDYRRFYVYLKNKFNATKIYYYIGAYDPRYKKLYTGLKKAGYILRFRLQAVKSISHKKGNVDTDIVFDVMRVYCMDEDVGFVLVTQDGDFFRLIRFLIKKGRLVKVLFPNARKASWLYRSLQNKYWIDLSSQQLRLELELVD